MEGDLFPMLAKWTEWQIVTSEHRLMFQMQGKEEGMRHRVNLNLYRRETELTKDMIKCADLVEYLNEQKILNLKAATSHVAEVALLDRRIQIARLTMAQQERCLDILKQLVDQFEDVFVIFLREVAKAMNYERPNDIVNRHTTLTTVKQESITDFQELHTKLHKLKEKVASVNDERMRCTLVLHNQKRDLFHTHQDLEEKNIQMATDVKTWQTLSTTTCRVLTQAHLHIDQTYQRLLAKKKHQDPFKARPGIIDMLQEIGKEIQRLTIMTEAIKDQERSDLFGRVRGGSNHMNANAMDQQFANGRQKLPSLTKRPSLPSSK